MRRVAILGGGYGGLAAARELAAQTGKDWRIVLVDRRPAHELTTRLPRVLSGCVTWERARIPYRSVLPRRVELVEAEISEIDVESRRVSTSAGSISPDWLVLALGAVPGEDGVPGVGTFGQRLKTVGDALALRRSLLSVAAESQLRVVVVGGGYTGTEVAGELSVWRPGPPHVTVAAEDPTLLPGGNTALSGIAERTLRQRGVRLQLGVKVAALEPGGVVLSTGEAIPSDLAVWAAPSVAAPVVRALGSAAPGGRITAGPDLRVRGLEHVYAVGDDAYFPQPDAPSLPSSAQVAVAAGIHAARSILLQGSDRPPTDFRPQLVGEALTLGADSGAAEILGTVVTGRLALAIKQAALGRYLYRLGGARLVRRYLTES